MSLTETVLSKMQVGASAWWNPGTFNLDIAAFQMIYERIRELAAEGVLEILDQHHESTGGRRMWDRVRVKRLK